MDMEDLSLICAGLGLVEEDDDGNRVGYSKGESCLDNMKDLLRFLRRDDPQTREVFKQVCKWKIVSKDLIPIIQFCQDDRSLVLNAVKVLVFLTMPVEPSSTDIPQQIEYLWGLKSAITCSNTVGIIVSLLEGPLENLEREMFTEDDWKLLQLVLTLFRNILAIQDMSVVQKVGGSACQYLSLRDRFVELLFRENVMELIVVITQHVGGTYSYLRQDNLLLLEIFHYIFMGQEPELIAKAHQKDSQMVGTMGSLDSLKSIMEEEEEKRRLTRVRNMGRHSQFSGAFTRVTMDGSKAVHKGNPDAASHSSLLKSHKIQRGPGKKIVWDYAKLPSTKDNLLELLNDFLNQFLSGGYNVLMQSIHDDIEKEHHPIQRSDISVFFQVAQFVTSFQYHKSLISKLNTERDTPEATVDEYTDSTLFKGDICGPIAASMNESMFLLVISRWRNAFDGLKETNDYKFLSVAGSFVKIMIHMLDLVLKLLPEDSKEPQTARILLYKLFYDQTDQGMTQFLLTLVKSFDTYKQPKSDLADLVEVIHVVVRLMETLQSRGALRVSKKSRKSRKKKTPSDKKGAANTVSRDEPVVQDQSVIPNTEQLTNSGKSQIKSQENATSDMPGIVYTAAEVNEPEMSSPRVKDIGSSPPQMAKANTDHMDDDLFCSSSDSENEQPPAIYEVDFKVSTFVSSFANHSIIKNLCWLLKFYKSNSSRTNHYIICLLRRITDDLDLSPMLYQLSLLTTFYDILSEQKSCPCKAYSNIVEFLTSLVRRMLRKMKNQPLLFVELLFWKSRRECHYINAEYLLHELGSMKKETTRWGNASVNEELGPSQSKGWVRRSIADALGEDEADVVIPLNLGDNNGVSLEHEMQGLSKRKRRLVLTDELETRIKDLYEKFKDDGNCSRLIAESLDPEGQVSPAQVFNKLKQLGLKVAPKKRMRHVDKTVSAPDEPLDKEMTTEKENDLHNLIDLEGSVRQSLTTRKRVRAFNKDQEEKITALFEQFKDHKKRNQMIASALAADNSISAAQVSRKLKQLGLVLPRPKRYKADMHLKDEDVIEFSAGEGQDSDDETLLSLRNRTKIKADSGLFDANFSRRRAQGESTGDADDELLSSMLRPKNKDGDISSGEEQNTGEVSNNSDDEILGSVLQKTRKVTQKSKDKKLTALLVQGRKHNQNSDVEVLKPGAKSNGDVQSTKMETENSDDSIAHINHEDSSVAEAIGRISENPSTVSPVKDVNLPMDNELAYLEDDVASDTEINTVPRRKLRMVLDDDEDDD